MSNELGLLLLEHVTITRLPNNYLVLLFLD